MDPLSTYRCNTSRPPRTQYCVQGCLYNRCRRLPTHTSPQHLSAQWNTVPYLFLHLIPVDFASAEEAFAAILATSESFPGALAAFACSRMLPHVPLSGWHASSALNAVEAAIPSRDAAECNTRPQHSTIKGIANEERDIMDAGKSQPIWQY